MRAARQASIQKSRPFGSPDPAVAFDRLCRLTRWIARRFRRSSRVATPAYDTRKESRARRQIAGGADLDEIEEVVNEFVAQGWYLGTSSAASPILGEQSAARAKG